MSASSDFQPFPITELKTGIYSYLQPWIRPQDAFDPLVNAYIYRGQLTKRNGSTIFGNQLEDGTPVMGIFQWRNESTGSSKLVVASQEFLYLYVPGAVQDGGTFSKLLTVAGSPFWSGTATGAAVVINTFWQNITHASPGTVSITDGTTTIVDDGSGNFASGGIFAAGGTIDYTTGIVTLNFTGTTSNTTLRISADLDQTMPYFSGNISNFFNSINWQPTSSETALSPSYLYVTNNVDPVTLFDGTSLARPGFYVNSTSQNYISNALDVSVYNNRLLLIRPFVTGEPNSSNQAIYFSAQFNPFNFVNDVAGNGGFLPAATGDIIQSTEFVRDNLIVFFSNSTWTFQITGLTNPPFLWRKINSSKTTKAPYSSIAYDDSCSSLGSTGHIITDGVTVDRYDTNIIDYYENEFSQQYYGQTFSQRYDNLNQTWMFFCSTSVDRTKFPIVNSVAPGSDSVLVYNFLEKTWATYKNSFPMTCMGLYFNNFGDSWASLAQPWNKTDDTWSDYSNQKLSTIILGGDTSGNIYHMDNGTAVRDGMSGGTGGTSFEVEITTTRLNPFIPLGQKVQFGYIDVYYSVSSFDPANPIFLSLIFYLDNKDTPALTKTLTLDGPSNTAYTWKRIYANLEGQFIQIEIDPNEDADFEILGFILWARPAGRFTP